MFTHLQLIQDDTVVDQISRLIDSAKKVYEIWLSKTWGIDTVGNRVNDSGFIWKLLNPSLSAYKTHFLLSKIFINPYMFWKKITWDSLHFSAENLNYYLRVMSSFYIFSLQNCAYLRFSLFTGVSVYISVLWELDILCMGNTFIFHNLVVYGTVDVLVWFVYWSKCLYISLLWELVMLCNCHVFIFSLWNYIYHGISGLLDLLYVHFSLMSISKYYMSCFQMI